MTDDCKQYIIQSECLAADILSGCVWNKDSKKCIQFNQNIPASAIEKPKCPGSKILRFGKFLIVILSFFVALSGILLDFSILSGINFSKEE